jgi:hypothetical protein
LKQESKEPAPSDALEFGKMIGCRQTFSRMAGKCTAADADCLKKTRDGKLYLGFARNWDECCIRHFGMSRANAERLIALLEEFGLAYFEVAQLTRVSPETFRALAPSIHHRTLHLNGEAIALVPENAARVAAVVAAHRKAALPGTTAPPAINPGAINPGTINPGAINMETRLDALDRRCNRLLDEFAELSGAWRDTRGRMMLGSVLARTRSALARLGLELGA